MNLAAVTSLDLTNNEKLVLAAVIGGMKNLSLRDEVTFEDIAVATGKPVPSVRALVGNLVAQGYLTSEKHGNGAEDPNFINLADEHMGLHPANSPKTATARILAFFTRPATLTEAKAVLADIKPATVAQVAADAAAAGRLVRLGRGIYAAA